MNAECGALQLKKKKETCTVFVLYSVLHSADVANCEIPRFLAPVHEDKGAEAVTESCVRPGNTAEIAFREAVSVRQLSLI